MTDVRKAVILAAGRGTRLGDLTRELPKPMLAVGGKPLLQWILEGLATAGVREACIIIGYLGERIRERFGDGREMGLRIEYREQTKLDGTGGALLLAGSFCDGPFFMCFGDILLHPASHYSAMAASFSQDSPDALLAANWVPDPCVGAAVYFDSRSIIQRIVEKPAPGTSGTHYNQAGSFIYTPSIIRELESVGLSPRGEIELTAGVDALLKSGRTVKAYPVPEGDWLDIGTPELLARTDGILKEANDA